MNKKYWRLIPFVFFILLAIFLWRGLSLDPHHLPSTKIGQSLPNFVLPAIQLKSDSAKSFTSQSMHGQIVLLNVWASWCAACSEEQFFLMKLAHEGFAIYGLNYKDAVGDATHWLEEWGNPYKMIGSDLYGQVAIDLGVYGAPETFLIDQNGIIQYRQAGVLTADSWEREFLPRIQKLRTDVPSPQNRNE